MTENFVDMMKELYPWTKEWPTEAGTYWFYGRRFRSLSNELDGRLELSFVEVFKTSVPGVLMYVTRGHFLYKSEGVDGFWLEVNIPFLPIGEEKTKNGEKTKND